MDYAHTHHKVEKQSKPKKEKMPKFHSRSVHGSGTFSEADIQKGYKCEPVMGE